jgi:DNA polymerase-3 subunit delta'
MADVFAALVGQARAEAILRRAAAAAAQIVAAHASETGDPATERGAVRVGTAAAGSAGGGAAVDRAAMTHAWLFTGPPGSGRSVAARAFAAALLCEFGTGCGACAGCHTTLAGTHADVRLVVPEGLTIAVAHMRELVLRAAGSPSSGRWQIVIIEDADRLSERAGNALLKAVEEPSPRTVFLLCAPSDHPDDVPVTIRSRCRVVPLVQPPTDAVAGVLMTRDGTPADVAAWAAAAAQGHVGRARRLAGDPQSRARREAVLAIPRRLTGIGACYDAASALIEAADAEAEVSIGELDAREKAELETALGAGGTGKGAATATRGMAGALTELAKQQKARATRTRRDCLDRALVDLAGFYRDVLLRTVAAPVPPVHVDTVDNATRAAGSWTPEATLRRLEAVLACREAIELNVKPLIAVESMMLALWRG